LIRGYPLDATVRAGETLVLAVAGDRKSFGVRFYRCGNDARAVSEGLHERRPLSDAPPGAAGSPWCWPEYRFAIPASWEPGAYVAAFDDDPPAQLDARQGRALFVLRPPEPRTSLLVVLPTFTYHAYNVAHVDGTLAKGEGECLYSGAPWVTLQRPGGGIGGHPWDEVNADAYDRSSPRQTFAHWDAKALAWLDRNAFDYDLCTDTDLHEGSVDLDRYRVVASFGHHEYWTQAMRENLERFIFAGGNVAFFGGNTMWFRAEFDPARRAIRRVSRWNDEWKTSGVTYACGGGRWIGERPETPYRVTAAAHAAFAGLSLANGDSFGAANRLAGYECDGAPDGSGLLLLARACLDAWPQRDGCGERVEGGHAAMGIRRHGAGEVFTASTVDWARVLAGDDPVVARITRNVLDLLGARVGTRA
jgi:hypothetical protein